MSNILLAYSNRADAATLAAGSWNGTLVLNNLKDDDLSLVARSADAKPSSTRFRFDLGDEYTLRTLALVNHTFSSAATWRVRLGRSPFDVDLTAEVLDERVTASGGVNGTVVNERGRIVKVTRTNYALRSQEFDNGSWGKTAGAVTANAATAPDGTTTADKFVPNTSATDHYVSQSVTLAAGPHTLSLYVKDAGYDDVAINLGGSSYAFFNLTRAEVGGQSGLSGSGIELAASGFYRIWITAVMAAGAAVAYIHAVPSGETTASAGDGTSGIYVWGAQIEDNSDATDYIPTTTATVTATISGGRRTFDPVGGDCVGRYSEEARTNLGLQSASADLWTATGAVVAANAAESPDGASDAATVAATVGVASYVQQGLGVAMADNTTYVRSVYAKHIAGAGTDIFLEINDGSGGAGQWGSARLNVIAGTVVSINGAVVAAEIEAAGGGWFRCAVKFATGAAAGSGAAAAAMVVYVENYGPAAQAMTVALWGGQLEAGALATSCIPTTSAAVTRTADVLSATGSNFSGFYNQGEGTIYVEASRSHGDYGATGALLEVSDNTAAERMQLQRPAAPTGLVRALVFDGAVAVGIMDNGLASASTIKLALAYKANDCAASLNAVAPVADSVVTLPSVDQLTIGRSHSGEWLNDTIARVTYWPERLTNSELQSITTSGPDALGYDSGWVDVQQMTFRGDTPSDWGAKYAAMVASSADVTARYGTVEIDDSTNTSARVDIGRLFVGGGLQPAYNASREGFADGRDDLSSVVTSPSGKRFGTERRRPRNVKFALRYLTDAEGQRIHEMQDEIGTLDEVMYVPDPADMAKSQRFGFLGYLRTLGALEYPIPLTNSVGIEIAEKL